MKNLIAAALLGTCALASAAPGAAPTPPWQSIGRPATPAEVKAWDIDVRADFTGLPKGRGSVALGEQVWEARCASCHGSFGESNEVFTPIVGGTTEADIKSGRVAALSNGSVPQRTTLMKAAHLSTLWDYINRAMPWNAPKTLTADEVYAVTAHILNLGGVVPADFVLSDENIASVQKLLPNRNGLVRQQGMWETKGKPDVANTACMKDCPVDGKVTSSLPDFARNAHGNLAEQNRPLGGLRGADTTRPAPAAPVAAAGSARAQTGGAGAGAAAAKAPIRSAGSDAQALLNKNGCTGCHAISNKILGPSFRDIAAKYRDRADKEAYLAAKIRNGGSGAWGSVPMPPQTQLKEADAKAISQWLAGGAQ
ncbi:c-type cytochrome [Pseudoduganella sp. OTU4001]|uniref:c-type cytochrome n=1 Tax=Pseudoduganella sp. OTU4001 TaxID=3043854 RepID=UPI00313B239C